MREEIKKRVNQAKRQLKVKGDVNPGDLINKSKEVSKKRVAIMGM